jgi:hypothetical protein
MAMCWIDTWDEEMALLFQAFTTTTRTKQVLQQDRNQQGTGCRDESRLIEPGNLRFFPFWFFSVTGAGKPKNERNNESRFR